MKCFKCGEELTPGDFFCTNCGAGIPQQQVVQQPVVNQPNQIPVPQHAMLYNGQQVNQQLPVYKYIQNQPIEDAKIPNLLCVISLLLRFAGPLLLSAFSAIISNVFEDFPPTITGGLGTLCSLAAFVLMIYVRIKYPSNKFGKILMWIYIAFIIIYILLFIFIIVACASCVSTFNY